MKALTSIFRPLWASILILSPIVSLFGFYFDLANPVNQENLISDGEKLTSQFWKIVDSLSPAAYALTLGTILISGFLFTISVLAGKDHDGKKYGLVSWAAIFRLICPYYYWKTILSLHQDFEHGYQDAIRNAKGFRGILDQGCRIETGELLKSVKTCLDQMLNADVAVHVKVFVDKEDTETGGAGYLEQSELITYSRVASKREYTSPQSAGYSRSYNEVFAIAEQKHGDPVSDTRALKESIAENKAISEQDRDSVNSAYQSVLFAADHHWICNNLVKAQDKGQYISTSRNWENYYNSLGVFLLFRRCPAGNPLTDDDGGLPFGLLIIDSMKTGRFDARVFRQLGGYFSHRIYEFMRYANSRN